MAKRQQPATQPAQPPAQASVGYAGFQLARALATAEHHEDPETRERARSKAAKWVAVFEGMSDGSIHVGSRQPVAGVPSWVTLEVATGGFSTGALLAGGDLQPHEHELLTHVAPGTGGADARFVLNRYFLSDAGLAELTDLLRSGRYDVTVPEEGALLVVAWLVGSAHADAARELIATIAPWFPQLRFYPVPRSEPRSLGSRVFVQDVAATIESLRRVRPNRRVLAQQQAVRVWAPLYDRMVALFLETVQGDPPDLARGPDGRQMPPVNGRFPVTGGWPCQVYPDGWSERGRALLVDLIEADRQLPADRRPARPNESFDRLRVALRKCVDDPKRLSGREVGVVRLILARTIARRGAPGSPQRAAARERQNRDIAAPLFHDVAQLVVPRLQRFPKDQGLEDLGAVTSPVSEDEVQGSAVPPGTPLPPPVRRKVERCLADTVDALVERGLITSGEALARVLPQMTSALRAEGITDPDLRRLYAAIYQAFRRRRSLLLLNLESQVKISELPWVAAIEPFRRRRLSVRDASRQALHDLAVLTLVSFPHVILPNKLVGELRALAKDTDLDLPLVEEVAADIFMGRFSGKFVAAAHRAAALLRGTLYERYYGIDYDAVLALPVPTERKQPMPFPLRMPEPDRFCKLCSARAGVTPGFGKVATNGMIIEQQQILTTQNLAVLVDGLGLRDVLRDRLEGMARHCFEWVCRRQQAKPRTRHDRLIARKNTAYAWRQMVFFLALPPDAQVQAFLSWAGDRLARQREPFATRFAPALRGLERAAKGQSPDDDSPARPRARRFLGWTDGEHWLF